MSQNNLSVVNPSVRRLVVVALALVAGSAVACGGGNAEESPATVAASGGTQRRACENVKSLAQVCYDSADPGVGCDLLGDTMRSEASKKGLDPSLQQDLGSLCQTACTQRKAGRSWSEISQRMDCSSRH